MQIGIIGLEGMGHNIMEKLLTGGHEILGWNKSKDVYDKLKIDKAQYFVQQKIKLSFSIEGMRETLRNPRVFWLTLSTKEETEEILAEIKNIAEPGDFIIDSGNSYFKDSKTRYDELTAKGIKYLDIGISGGRFGLENGYCIMVGGNKEGYEYLRPALDSLAVPNGAHNYFGLGGAGHFMKMVTNGIEYAMAQALCEGLGILEKSPYALNLVEVGYLWQRGSDLMSVLLDTAVKVFNEDQNFIKTEGVIPVPSESKMLVEQAKAESVPFDVIGKTLDFEQRSQFDKAVQTTFAAKIMAAMSKRIGGN